MDSSTAAAAATRSASDEETYATISSAPPKRRAGRTKFRETRHPVYKGVRRRNADRWVCEVREPNKKSRIWLGTFPTAEMAARAHDVAAIALRGRSACLNFADSAWLLPAPESSSPRDIQRAAAAAAEAFRPPSTESDPTANETGLATGDGVASRSDANKLVDEFPFAEEDGLNMGMQGYFDMAQGMLIDPPLTTGMMTMPEADDQLESDGEMSLWSYSI